MGQKQKTEKKKKERKRERKKDNGDNNGQATHGARKHAWRTQAAWANTHGARMAHAWRTQAAWAKKFDFDSDFTRTQKLTLI